MSNNFSFGSINTASKKNVLKVKLESDFVITEYFKSPTQPLVNIILDQYYTSEQMDAINLFLKSNGLRNYRIMAGVNSKEISPQYVKEVLNEPIIKFYKNNQSDFKKMLEPGDIVVTTGASIYSMTETGDIYTNDMYDVTFSPSKIAVDGYWVYVVDSFSDIFANGFRTGAVDSFKTKIFQFRLKDIVYNGKVKAPTPTRRKHVMVSNEEFDQWATDILKKNYSHMSCDTETSGFDFMKNRIGDVTVAFDHYTGYHFFFTPDKVPKLNQLLLHHKIIGANFKFDAKFFWAAGVIGKIEWAEDVFKLGHTLNETRHNSLKTLSYLYTPNGGYDKALDAYKEKVKVVSYIDDIPDEYRIPYAIDDAIQTFMIWEEATKHMRLLDEKFPNERFPENTLETYYRNIRMPVDNMYARIEYRGVYVSKEENRIGREDIQKTLLEMKHKLYGMFDIPLPVGLDGKFDDSRSHPFDSPAELGRLLESLGWEDLGRGKGKNAPYLTGDFQLERWGVTHPVATVLQRYRSASTILKSFVGDEDETKGWAKHFRHHEDGTIRMHQNFNTMGTDTGRSKCSNPNTQNPPAHGEFAGNATRMMNTKDDDNYYMVTVDYSALQLRLATIDSGDPVLREVFKSEHADMHSLTGFNVIKDRYFNIETIEVEEDGKKYTFLGAQQIRVMREGKETEIFATELKEGDKLA